MILDKYNVAVPRYTSFPTVPYWQKTLPQVEDWKSSVRAAILDEESISLYIHLPFCESLCTYCGCNKRITKNHSVEAPYIQAVLKEWELYKAIFPIQPVIKEIHLGGGTPTFFSPDQLEVLINGITKGMNISEDHEFSFEAHPFSTTEEHMSRLAKLGFNRISIGVQDFGEEILKIINRHQTTEQVENVVKWARKYNYQSVNFDLIFGLPLQTPQHIKTNMAYVKALRPERIAFYSYAHVPWISPSQRAYSEADLPKGKEKRALYELGKEMLEEAAYVEIGLDHFALKRDDLYQAWNEKQLHRNFMGYTPQYTRLSIALGASSIGDSWNMYVQNEKKIEIYKERVLSGAFPIIKGHELTLEEQIIRKQILNLMCHNETTWGTQERALGEFPMILSRLRTLEEDGLVTLEENGVKVTNLGRPYIRNICNAFDLPYWQKQPKKELFSQAV